MKKKSKIKEYYQNFKDLWAHPKYRALIKLSLYAIMFLIIIVMSNLYEGVSSSHKNEETEQTKTYTEIINSINLDNCDILYNIKTLYNEYKLDGKIKENNLTGYIEKDEIKKITIKDNLIYQIDNNIETIDEELTSDIIVYFLIPKNIVNLVQNESAYINKGEKDTTYEFNINYNNENYAIRITINNETITNININNNQLEYNMELDFDKTP